MRDTEELRRGSVGHRPTLTMFESRRAYIVAFVLYALCVWPMIRVGIRRGWFLHTPNERPQFINVIGALFCIVFFTSLITKTDNTLEKYALISSIGVSVVWMLRILAGYGFSWASVPASFAVSTGFAVIATALVGIRAIQSSRKRN
jgi:hypothetical protein